MGLLIDIHAVDVVLFLHIAAAVFAFGVAGLLLAALAQMRRAQSVAVLRSWQRLAHRIEPWFPIIVLVFLGLGGWLIASSHNEFSWSDGWVITSVAALVMMLAYGGATLAPNGKRLHAMIEDTPEGFVPDQVHAAVMNPAGLGRLVGRDGPGPASCSSCRPSRPEPRLSSSWPSLGCSPWPSDCVPPALHHASRA